LGPLPRRFPALQFKQLAAEVQTARIVHRRRLPTNNAKRNWNLIRNNFDKMLELDEKTKEVLKFSPKNLASEVVNVAKRMIKRFNRSKGAVAGAVAKKVCPERTNDKEEKLIWTAITKAPGFFWGVYGRFINKLPDLKNNPQLLQAKCIEPSKLLGQIGSIAGHAKTVWGVKGSLEIADRIAFWFLGDEIYNGKGCLGKPPCSNKERDSKTRKCKCGAEWDNSLFDELLDTPKDIMDAVKAVGKRFKSVSVSTDYAGSTDQKVPPKSAGVFGTVLNWVGLAPNTFG